MSWTKRISSHFEFEKYTYLEMDNLNKWLRRLLICYLFLFQLIIHLKKIKKNIPCVGWLKNAWSETYWAYYYLNFFMKILKFLFDHSFTSHVIKFFVLEGLSVTEIQTKMVQKWNLFLQFQLHTDGFQSLNVQNDQKTPEIIEQVYRVLQ